MSKILPLRNVRGPSEYTECEICQESIDPGTGYPIISDEKVTGWVCEDCFSSRSPRIIIGKRTLMWIGPISKLIN